MKWSELTDDEKDETIARQIFGWIPVRCDGDQKYIGVYDEDWRSFCYRCNEDEDRSTGTIAHSIIPYKTYRSDLGDAWQIVREMNKHLDGGYDRYHAFITALTKIIGSDMFFDLFYCDNDGDHLTPDSICLAALIACGVEIEEE